MDLRFYLLMFFAMNTTLALAVPSSNSPCQLYMSDDAYGIVFPNAAVADKIVAPAEVVRMFFAFCVNKETKKNLLVVGEQYAFFDGDKLRGGMGCGPYDPDFAFVTFDITGADIKNGRATHEISLQHRNRATEDLRVQYDISEGDIIELLNIRLTRSLKVPKTAMEPRIFDAHVYAQGTKANHEGSMVALDEWGITAVSVSNAEYMKDMGKDTWKNISDYMNDQQFRLPRTTRKQ